MIKVNDRVKIVQLSEDLEDFIDDNGVNFADELIGTEGTANRVRTDIDAYPIYVMLDFNDEEYCFSKHELIKIN